MGDKGRLREETENRFKRAKAGGDPFLLEIANDRDVESDLRAKAILSLSGGSSEYASAMAALTRDDDRYVRVAAARKLSELRDRSSLRAIVRESADPAVVAWVIHGLAEAEDREMLPLFVDSLTSSDSRIVDAAIAAIRSLAGTVPDSQLRLAIARTRNPLRRRRLRALRSL